MIGAEVAELGRRQHGVVARRQLLDLGLSPRQIHYLITCAALHPIYRGVYALGHRRLTQHARWTAAVVSAGPEAVLSHYSAAMLWELVPPSQAPPHVTTPSRRRPRRNLHLHSASLAADETATRQGIPVTTVARTLLDLAGCVDRHRLERAMAEAEYRRHPYSRSLGDLLGRHRGRRGNATLRAVLASGNAKLGKTRSPLEERFLRFLDARGLERPELNVPFDLDGEPIEVDCLWRPQRIAVELDGRTSHLRARQWEADRRRDRRLLAAQWKPARVTEEQLELDHDELEADLRALGIGSIATGKGASIRHRSV